MTPRTFPRVGRVHFVGIGGVGMSGIAEVLLNLGHVVSGSDRSESAATRRLASLGATIRRGHEPGHVEGAGVVVVSSAIRPDNVEILHARALGIPVIPRAEMLAELMRLKHGIAVAGSHGKTTTTSLVAQVLAEGGLDPTVVVGGRVKALGGNARMGRGEWMVCEADESDGSFLRLTPTLAVVTNIDAEHLEAYEGSIERLQQAFADFCNAVPFYGAAILCLDDPRVQAILPRITRRVVTYGFSVQADITMRHLDAVGGSLSYEAVVHGEEMGRVAIGVPGRHVALNSLAALAAGLQAGLRFEQVARGLAAFEGVDRRMSVRGTAAGVRVIDDYAHHPTEIKATLQAVREAWPEGRVIAIFQPHRYSRVEALKEEFYGSFNLADVVLACDIHAAGEEPLPGVTPESIVAGIRSRGHRSAETAGSPDQAALRAAGLARPGDTILTLGAGDVTRAAEQSLAALAQAEERELPQPPAAKGREEP